MRGFLSNNDGSLTLLSLIFFMIMFLLGGLAVDMLVFENNRTRLQNLSDRASLAAADLDQTVDPTLVVESYFEKEGLDDYLGAVTITDAGGARTVGVEASHDMKTMFMRMVGTTDLTAPAAATAGELAARVEISLVLDNSGSMGSTDGDNKTRLDELKEAVATFLGVMYPAGADPNVTVSLVPYASQVNAGPLVTNLLSVTAEHTYSDCIEFDVTDFGSLSLGMATTYIRSAHFDQYGTQKTPSVFKCRPDTDQHVYVMGSDPSVIQGRVDALSAQGWTSLDLGAKWGAALLDPATAPLVQGLIASGQTDILAQHASRPSAYADGGTVKALILMTDGINTETQNMDPAHKDGPSDLWRRGGSLANVIGLVPGLNGTPSLQQLASAGIDVDADRTYYSYGFAEGPNSDLDGDGMKNEGYWTPAMWIDGTLVIPEQWTQSPLGVGNGTEGRLNWPEVWATFTPEYYAETFVEGPSNSQTSANAFMSALYSPVTPATKDSRLDTLCTEARDQGLTVYTVGLNVNDHSRGVLRDCAATPSFFLDANTDNLSDAFEQIAQSIVNQKLRLIH